MEINRENILSVWMDYREGRLSETDYEKFSSFIKSHPDLIEEFEEMEMYSLEPEFISFPGKQSLKKSLPVKDTRPGRSNFDLFAIAYLENDLDDEQRIEFDKYLKEFPEMEKEFLLFSKSRLIPETISFPQKHKLKKKAVRSLQPVWILIPAAIAASIAVLMLIFTNPRLPDTLSDIEIPETGPGLEIQIADAGSNENITSKNPIVITEKEKPLPPELSGETRKQINDSDKTISENEIPDDDMKDFQVSRAVLKQNLNVSGISGSNPVIAEFQPVPDLIRPVTLPVVRSHSGGMMDMGIAGADFEGVLEDLSNRDISFWSIANYGIEGVNRLAGTEMKLLANRDEEGTVSRFEFSSKLLKISAPVPKTRSADNF